MRVFEILGGICFAGASVILVLMACDIFWRCYQRGDWDIVGLILFLTFWFMAPFYLLISVKLFMGKL